MRTADQVLPDNCLTATLLFSRAISHDYSMTATPTGTVTFHALAALSVAAPMPVSPDFRHLVLNVGKSNQSDLLYLQALLRVDLL